MVCRICSKEVEKILDLGSQPIANSLLNSPHDPEMTYPLEFFWCRHCQFGQVNDLLQDRIFGSDYPYYSSINKSYVDQCAEWAKGYLEFYNPKTVLEIGCNDGYMLQNFKHLDHIGYEPSKGPAEVATKNGISVVRDYFKGTDHFYADLIIANNVLAHTPNLHTMVNDIAKSLSTNGEAVIEFPDVTNMVRYDLYDTIYHEHYSYFSLEAITKLFQEHGLYLNYHEDIPSHGGSIRAYFSKKDNDHYCEFNKLDLSEFKNRVLKSKRIELHRLLETTSNGQSIALFGAAAKGNTFLNYLGIKNDLFQFCVDDTPAKQGKFLPGSRIPIVNSDALREFKPSILFILPWNFKSEIMEKTKFITEWKGTHIWRIF